MGYHCECSVEWPLESQRDICRTMNHIISHIRTLGADDSEYRVKLVAEGHDKAISTERGWTRKLVHKKKSDRWYEVSWSPSGAEIHVIDLTPLVRDIQVRFPVFPVVGVAMEEKPHVDPGNHVRE